VSSGVFMGYTKNSLRKAGDYLDHALFVGVRGLLKDQNVVMNWAIARAI